MPELKKAELIAGIVYLQPEVALDDHGAPHAHLAGWVGYYTAYTDGVCGGINPTVRLDQRNVPQPDVLLLIRPECGGQSTITDGFITSAPEWVGEITASSASYDLHSKLAEYHRSGVQEYVVWRVWDRAIDWFLRREHGYEKLAPENGIYRSQHFPGLWLDAEALLDGRYVQVLAVLQQGLQTPEHAAFCDRLRERAKQ